MALSERSAKQHIDHWRERLGGTFHSYRKRWPRRLFHHAPLENAIQILGEGCLRSRNDPANRRVKDVASREVVAARDHAHDFVRLYFRPKTPTQWHTEGIRKLDECLYGENTHIPVFIMFALDAESLLTTEGVQFCDRNMQLGSAVPGSSEEYFSAIPFHKVYSEGSTGGDRSITDARSAEVLVDSPLSLRNCLREIYFRSEAERDTLLYLLGDSATNWRDYCVVSDSLRLFNKNYSFVTYVYLSFKGLTFQFNPRNDYAHISVRISVSAADSGRSYIKYANETLRHKPEKANYWHIERELPSGSYLVEIDIEGHTAFKSEIALGDVIF